MRTKEETEQLLAEGRAVVQVSADERPRFAGSRVDCDRLLYAVGRVVAADFQCLDHIRELVGARTPPVNGAPSLITSSIFPAAPHSKQAIEFAGSVCAIEKTDCGT